MKRREFLASSISAAGVLLPELAAAESKPCPPPAVTVSGGTASDANCIASSAGAVPDWFAKMPDRTWTFVGAGTGAETITDGAGVVHSVQQWQRGRNPDQSYEAFVGPDKAGGTGFRDHFAAWCGGCVDDTYGELLTFGGGHTSYPGNDIHAIALREEIPSWRCLNADTMTPKDQQKLPGWDTGNDCVTANPLGAYLDGQIAPTHSWNSLWSIDGTLWTVGADAAGRCSNTSNAIYKYTRGGRWQYVGHGMGKPVPAGQPTYTAEAAQCVYDPVTRKVYRHYGSSNQPVPGHLFSVDVDSGAIKNDYATGAMPANSFNTGCPSIAIPEKNALLMVYDLNDGGRFFLYNTNKMNAAPRNLRQSTGGITVAPGASVPPILKSGGVYHAPSNAMLLWGQGYGANIGKLSIPTDPFTGVFTWQPMVMASSANTVTPTAPTTNGTYGRANIVRMGQINGDERHALVVVNRTQEPVWVYKLPESGV